VPAEKPLLDGGALVHEAVWGQGCDLKKIGADALILFFNRQTMHRNPKTHSSIVMFFLETLYPGGIWTRVCCLWGWCDVHCATPPPGQSCDYIFFAKYCRCYLTQNMNHKNDFFKEIRKFLTNNRSNRRNIAQYICPWLEK
jgi:hypothetical protein